MWDEMIQAIVSRLRDGDTALEVHVGGSAEVPRCRRVYVMRGPGTPQTEFAETGRMEQQVFVECWEHDREPADANQRLAALENYVFEQLHDFRELLVEGWATIVAVTSVEPDGDQFRPSIASRTTIRIRAKRARTSA